jgi:LPXTG-site transpeptidase (sortase) family protein
MRNFIVTVLNIAGIGLLLAAALVAWNVYNSPLPAVPSDVTIVDEYAPTGPPPAPELTTAASVTDGVVGSQVVPVFLPETKAPAVPQDDAPSMADRRINLSQLAAERAKAFPPPAHSPPTRLVLPSIHVDSPVIEVGWKTSELGGQLVSEWEVADFAVGFLKITALPGARGNTVMAGHNNIKGEVFKNLIDLKIGDELFVFVDKISYRYIVKQKLLLKESGVPLEQRLQNAEWIAPTDDTRLTLVSCWPYTSNTHRVIIVATPNG